MGPNKIKWTELDPSGLNRTELHDRNIRKYILSIM